MKKSVGRKSWKKASNDKVARRLRRAQVPSEEATGAGENSDAKPAVKGGAPKLIGLSDLASLTMADQECGDEIFDSVASPAGQVSATPKPEGKGFALEDLQAQAAEDDFIFLGLRMKRVQPNFSLQLVEKISIGPDEAVARKILRAVKAVKEGTRDW